MCVFDQADDACQYCFCAQRQGFDDQTAFAIDGAASDFIPRLFRYGQAFAADQCFVCVALAFDHFTVHREAFAGFDQHPVIEAQVADGDVLLYTIDHAQGAFGAQRFKGTDGAGRLAFGTAFEVFAQQHQCDYYSGGFKVQVRHCARRRDGPLVQAQTVPGTGAERDQQVHIACTGFDGFPGGDIKPRAEDELHGCSECELCPRRQHPMDAERHEHHRQHQR